jgi:hypothetical protein
MSRVDKQRFSLKEQPMLGVGNEVNRGASRKAMERRRRAGFGVFGLSSVLLLAGFLGAPPTFAGPSPLTLSPRVVALGEVAVDTPTSTTVKVTNSGVQPLRVDSYEAFGLNGNFAVHPGSCILGTTLRSGGSCLLNVVTSPPTVGVVRGTFCLTGVGRTTYDRECGRIVGVAR